MHSDGGGWHQLAIPELGLDEKVGPRSTMTFEVPASAAPGEYAFYCDICCGGKENPSMQGVLKVTA
jgi:heme/copper-type cytochrome/quinol oxidase subunit 2